MFQQFGTNNNFIITNDVDGTNFNSLSNLQQFDLIVFSNTSGNTILDNIQKLNFENYINNGGTILGIHSATDTYKHSSANRQKRTKRYLYFKFKLWGLLY